MFFFSPLLHCHVRDIPKQSDIICEYLSDLLISRERESSRFDADRHFWLMRKFVTNCDHVNFY